MIPAVVITGLFAYSGMLVKAPRFTLLASAVFGGILAGLYVLAYLTLTLRVFG